MILFTIAGCDLNEDLEDRVEVLERRLNNANICEYKIIIKFKVNPVDEPSNLRCITLPISIISSGDR